MKIGLEHLGPPACLNLFMMLRFAFVAQLGRYVWGTQIHAETDYDSRNI
jgi:hypothetical protein